MLNSTHFKEAVGRQYLFSPRLALSYTFIELEYWMLDILRKIRCYVKDFKRVGNLSLSCVLCWRGNGEGTLTLPLSVKPNLLSNNNSGNTHSDIFILLLYIELGPTGGLEDYPILSMSLFKLFSLTISVTLLRILQTFLCLYCSKQ